MMTAKEASELTKNDININNLWYRLRISWMCGIINQRIRKTAESGEDWCRYKIRGKRKRKYYHTIQTIYETLGYRTGMGPNFIYIYWDKANEREENKATSELIANYYNLKSKNMLLQEQLNASLKLSELNSKRDLESIKEDLNVKISEPRILIALEEERR